MTYRIRKPKKKFKVGDKVRVAYICDCDSRNGQIGTITWLHTHKFYPNGDTSVIEERVQGTITYPDGSVYSPGDMYREGSGVVSPIEKVFD